MNKSKTLVKEPNTKSGSRKTRREERQFVQITMSDFVMESWDKLAKTKQKFKKDILQELIVEYISRKSSFQFHPNYPSKYVVPFSASTGCKARSIWLDQDTYTMAEKFSRSVSIKINRLIYSALIEGLLRENIMDTESIFK
ncbi:hypothetical protein [Thalassotalea marina]|uniref:Uncharacterized protein n=1 Tax=Thalassotalea marina TaxID=1673741 RepID=A0A919EPM4_9GAMM|nr:hypothetical protein [Thalassotalea marina]GHG07019.1 hypothetical protein GCM10017161_40800 [Thalassotalea marina]